MDKSARNTQFKDVVAHMDGLHSRAKGLITLTLWVTNPVSLITHHLACMDCERENTENVALFLKLFNEILCKVKKDPTFIWSVRGIMVDEMEQTRMQYLGHGYCVRSNANYTVFPGEI